MQVRSATDVDVDAIVELWDRAAGPTRLPGRHEAVRALLARDPDALVVACDDASGTVVGTLIVGWDGWRCHLYRMAVEPSARRRGIGQALMAAADERARRLGAKRHDAMVDDGNELGIAFWDAIGFAPDTHDRRWSRLVDPAS
jgi:ribosomal protein S18 acetylase RimI-like enzyme